MTVQAEQGGDAHPDDQDQADQPHALDAIAADAAALEGGGTAADGQAVPTGPTVEQTAAELASVLQMCRMMIAPGLTWWADFPKVWSDQTLQGIATNGAAIMQRHGWTMGEALAEWGPYIGLAGVTIPPALVTYQAVKMHREQLRREAQQIRPVHPGMSEMSAAAA